MNTAVKERPILFSAPMVRAILDGKKTQTRRILKKQPTAPATMLNFSKPSVACWAIWPGPNPDPEDGRHPDHGCKFPFGVVGERLWVREAFLPQECVCQSAPAAERGPCQYCNGTGKRAVYKADATCADDQKCCGYTSPIFMPRWASRITLEITGVRVKRLQDISEADAKAEGFEYREHFIRLWDKINGYESFTANPWVWVIEFKRITP